MKYRIKIITYKTGRKQFFAQAKCSFLGWDGLDYDGKRCGYDSDCDTREDALRRIDKHYSGNTKKQTITFEYIIKPDKK